MANTVIKNDGSEGPFDESKIRKSIETAAKEAGLPDGRIEELVEQVTGVAVGLAEGKEKIATSELRESILSKLDEVEPAVSEAWRKHDETKGGV